LQGALPPESWRNILDMADRQKEIIEAMRRLAEKASELAVEHNNTIEEYRRLKAELEAIRQRKPAKREARAPETALLRKGPDWRRGL